MKFEIKVGIFITFYKFLEHSGSTIPITVRQLEAIVRMSESLAKMELLPFVEERHIDEALRLFQVSTLAAVATGNLSGLFLD